MNLISYTHTNFKIHRHLFILPWGYLNPKKASACWGEGSQSGNLFQGAGRTPIDYVNHLSAFSNPKSLHHFFQWNWSWLTVRKRTNNRLQQEALCIS